MVTKIEYKFLLRSSRENKLNHLSVISKGLCTKPYASIISKRLKKKGLIKLKKSGRKKKVEITEKGKKEIEKWQN